MQLSEKVITLMQFNGALTEEKQYRTNRNLAMDGWIRVQWEK